MVQKAQMPVSEAEPSLEEWQQLYEAAIRLKELAPWDWMAETDIFGVEDPETAGLGFASVMGKLGEHYAVTAYLGDLALYQFWGMVRAGPAAPPESILEVAQLQASFEDRAMLSAHDRQIIKDLGLKFRGRQAWPFFRSYQPGFVPWYLQAGEVRFLTTVLLQTLDVAPRFRADPSLLEGPTSDLYLVRALRRADGAAAWEDRWMQVPPPAEQPIEIKLDMRLLQDLRKLDRRVAAMEVDLFMVTEGVRDNPQERPYFPYMLLIVEPESGLVVGNQLLTPKPSLDAMWGGVPNEMARQLLTLGGLPNEIRVHSGLLGLLLQPLAEKLGLRVKQVKSLRRLNAVKKEFMAFLRR